MAEKSCQVEWNRDQLSDSSGPPRMVKNGFSFRASQRPSNLKLLVWGKRINFDEGPGDRYVEGFTPCADNDAQASELSLQCLDFRGCTLS